MMSRALLLLAAIALASGCALDPVPLEGRMCRTYLDCLVGQGYYCQPIDAGDGVDGGVIGVCVLFDAAAFVDGGVDGGRDAGTDASMDAGMDAGAIDAGSDAGNDAAVDGGADAGNDADLDAGTDANVDGGTDAGFDANVDAG